MPEPLFLQHEPRYSHLARKEYLQNQKKLKLASESNSALLSTVRSIEIGGVVFDALFIPFTGIAATAKLGLLSMAYMGCAFSIVGVTCFSLFAWLACSTLKKITARNSCLVSLEIQQKELLEKLQDQAMGIAGLREAITQLPLDRRGQQEYEALFSSDDYQAVNNDTSSPLELTKKEKCNCYSRAGLEGLCFTVTLYATFCANTFSVMPALGAASAASMLAGPIGITIAAISLLVIGVVLAHQIEKVHEQSMLQKKRIHQLKNSNRFFITEHMKKDSTLDQLNRFYHFQNQVPHSPQ